MKIRTGFVSNSSSSSFVISKHYLSPDQIAKIYNHIDAAKEAGMDAKWFCEYDAWNIKEDEDNISGETSMDNFCMSEFLEKIGISSTYITWTEHGD